jgi:hypothetical protein
MNIIQRHKPIARKQHRCDWCGLPIEIAEQYEVAIIANEGTVYRWKNHTICGKVGEKLEMFWDGGITGEEFRDNIEEEYRQIMYNKNPDLETNYVSFTDQYLVVKNELNLMK